MSSEPVGNSPRGPSSGNSHKERAAAAPVQQPQEREKVEKIVEGTVVTRKPPLWKRFARGMVADDVGNIGDYILVELIFPALKKTLFEIVTGTTERTLYGSRAGGRRTGGPGLGLRGDVGGIRHRYDKIEEEREPRRMMSRDARARHDFQEVILDSRSEAADVIDALMERIERYRSASVADLYDMLGVTGSFADRKYGWTSLFDAEVRQYHGGWLLDLPRPELLR